VIDNVAMPMNDKHAITREPGTKMRSGKSMRHGAR
jgi:hypothetical protein